MSLISLVMHNTTALTLSCRELCEPFGTNIDCRYPGGPCDSRHLFNSPYLSPSSDSKLPTLYCPIHTIEELSPELDLSWESSSQSVQFSQVRSGCLWAMVVRLQVQLWDAADHYVE